MDLSKDFVGKAALEEVKAAGAKKRLVTVLWDGGPEVTEGARANSH